MARFAGGVIVGSATVRLAGQYKTDAAPVIGRYVRSMKAAIS